MADVSDLLSALPYPLAQVYLRARNAKSPAERHHNSYYLLEAALKTNAALGISRYIGAAVADSKVDKTLESLAQPSVGQWVGIAREVAQHFAGQKGAEAKSMRSWGLLYSGRTKDYPKCSALLRAIVEEDEVSIRVGEKLSPADVYDALPAYRNKHLGHGAMASEAFFKRFALLLKAAAEELLAIADPLAGAELILVDEKKEVGGGDVCAELIRLSGATPIRLDPLSGSPDAMQWWSAGRLYAVWQDSEPVSLHPLVIGSYADDRAEVSFYNRKGGTGSAEYLNYTTGRLSKEAVCEEDFAFLEGLAASKKRGGPKTHARESGAAVSPRKGERARRPSVAVLGFKNIAARPDAAWLSTALSEFLTTELAAGGRLRTVPGENVARMKMDLSLPEAESFSRETLGGISANIGCDFVVLGSYLALGDRAGGSVRLDLRVQDVTAGATVATFSEQGSESEFLDLVTRAGASLRDTFGVASLTESQERQVRAVLPSSMDALKLYAEGLEKLRRHDAMGARETLERVVAAEPGHAMAHAALSEAWAFLGYDERAQGEAEIAYNLSGELSREDSLLAEGRYREASREWDRAVEIYKTLFNFFPDSAEFGIRLAETLIGAGRPKEASLTISALRRLPGPSSNDPRIDLAHAKLHQALSDFAALISMAREAASKAEMIGAMTLMARAKFMESYALGLQGEMELAIAAAYQSRALFEKAGDMGGKAEATNAIALNRWRMGNPQETRRLFEEALDTFHSIGKRRGVASVLNNLSLVLYSLGNMGEARKKGESALELYREIGDRKTEADVLNNLSAFMIEEGDTVAAREALEECLKLYKAIGNKLGEASTIDNLGTLMTEEGLYGEAVAHHKLAMGLFEIAGNKEQSKNCLINLCLALMEMGDLEGALSAGREAEVFFRRAGQRSYLAYALGYIGRSLLFKGDIDGSRCAMAEARSIREELCQEKELAIVLTDWAILSNHTRDCKEAEEAAGKAVEILAKLKAEEEEANALCALSEALAAQGHIDSANLQLKRALSPLLTLDHPHFRMLVTISAARVQLLAGDPGKAQATHDILEARLAEAGGRIPMHQRYEARLLLAELAAGLGRTKEAHKYLLSLQKEALSTGHGLVAELAAEASKRIKMSR